MTEHDLQNLIRLTLSKQGWCVFRANVGKFQMKDGRWFDTGLPKGFSDLFAVKDGKIVFLEVKTPTGKVRPEQVNFIQQTRKKYGCKAGIVRSVNDALKLAEEN